MRVYSLIFLFLSFNALLAASSYLETSLAKMSNVPKLAAIEFMETFFKDVKIVHVFNIQEEHSFFAVTPYLKYFHGQLDMSYTISHTIEGRIHARLTKEARNTHAEAYLVYIRAPTDFYTVLQTVKKTSPLARCIFIYDRGSYDEAVQRVKFAWERFELYNVVVSTIDDQNNRIWCMYNPFSGLVYNMATSSYAKTHLSDIRNLKDFNGFPVTITKPQVQGSMSKKIPAGLNILKIVLRMVNASCQVAAGGYQYGKDLQPIDIDSFPHTMRDVSHTDVRYLIPLNQAEVFAAAPKIRHQQSSPSSYVSFTRKYYRAVSMLFCIILTMAGIITRRLFGPTPESEFTHLLLMSLGMICSLATHPYKDTKLRIVSACLMISAIVVNNILLGSLIEHLNVPIFNEINSLSKLLEADINIVTVPFVYTSFEHVTGDHIMQRIKAKLRIMPFPEDNKDPIFEEGRYAFLLPKEKAYSMAETIYDDQGNDLIYVVPEKIHALYVAFVARRELSFAWKIDELILQMLQHGIILYEFDRMFMAVKLLQVERVRQGKVVGVELETIGLKDLGYMVHGVVILLIASVLVFVAELTYFQLSKQIRPFETRVTEFCQTKCRNVMMHAYEFGWVLIVYVKTRKIN